jgi:uncharacterized protein (DUF2225 family)
MPKLSSPFVHKPVMCPACKKEYPQRYFRQRLFIPEEREADHHVTRYTWTSDTVERVHPPYYFLFFCPYCFFVDTTEDYVHPFDGDYGGEALRAFKKAEGPEKAIVQLLGGQVYYDVIDHESALALHLLAIHVHRLPQKEVDHHKVGRLYLRLAWLYREGGARESEARAATDEAADAALNPAREVITAASAFASALHRTDDALQTLSEKLEAYTQVLESEGRTRDVERLADCATRVGQLFNAQHANLDELRELCQGSISADVEDAGAADATASRRPDSMRGQWAIFAANLAKVWPDFPKDEVAAMQAAITHLREGMDRDPRFDAFEAQHSMASLVTELYVRCNDLDGAYGMLRGMYKQATDARSEYQETIRKEETSDSAKRRLQGRLNRVNAALEQLGDLRRDILRLLIRRDTPRIRKALPRLEGMAPAEVAGVLQQQGILPEVVRAMQRPGGLLADTGKKRGIFS